MIKVLTTFVLLVVLTIIRRYFIHYFDGKKIDAYSVYALIMLYGMTICTVYLYEVLLIVERVSVLQFLTFFISFILFVIFILSTCISLCTAINNFTIFKNKYGEVFEKKSKNHNFFKDLIMLDKVTDIYQLTKMKRSSYHQKYQCDKYYYQDKDANSYYEYVYLYKKNSFMRMKRICPKRTEHLTLIVLLLFLFNGLYIYIALDNIPYKYSNSDYTEYTLIICNALLCIVGCIIISKLQSNIIKENKKDKSSKMNDIKLSEEKYNFKNIT
ncbi:hypothetical protein [Staphylococcus haemolyticus]|uniref:hypothetical protein n=1 Tax=Staphylococcus haemolyticus TaxID=1283 RepID=UPI001F2A7652|nr:hypothetical protein [Staphylococcus haemolyticus]MCE4988762.1 hypothetical protein [Staphylococcus haemolyticus]MCE5037401.1 hypothetical protein [Staphylococcus haemolyticus]